MVASASPRGKYGKRGETKELVVGGFCSVVKYIIGVTRNEAAHMIWVFILLGIKLKWLQEIALNEYVKMWTSC